MSVCSMKLRYFSLVLLFVFVGFAGLGYSQDDVPDFSGDFDPFADENEVPAPQKSSPSQAEFDPLAEDDEKPGTVFDPGQADFDPFSDEGDDTPASVHNIPDPLTGMDDEEYGGSADKKADDEPEYPIKITNKHYYRVTGGYTKQRNGGISQDEETAPERKFYLNQIYQFTNKIELTPFRYIYLRSMAYFQLLYNAAKGQYSEDLWLNIREGYFYQQQGKHRVTLGAQILRLGKVDYNSSVDILNMSNSKAIEELDLDESKVPVLGGKYDWLGDTVVLTLYVAPFKQKTDGTEFSISQKEQEDEKQDKDVDDRIVLRNHFGVQMQTYLGDSDFRISLFRWFDRDNAISWKDSPQSGTSTQEEDSVTDSEEQPTSNDSNSNQRYTERDTTITFGVMELDTNVGNFVWKTDLGLFGDKNFYHFEKIKGKQTLFEARQFRHLSLETSMERKYESLFLMPTYHYWLIPDIPTGTHLLNFENEEEPLEKIHSVYKHQLALIASYEFNDDLRLTLTGSVTTPFEHTEVYGILNWNPDRGPHELTFKHLDSQSEVLRMTDQAITLKKTFMEYKYAF
ncbi:MAG: hypothetical protein HQM12_19355 [SAR324 cluster bacterium]|nr:hypothetical protein [SAR324 cluster bacterium]